MGDGAAYDGLGRMMAEMHLSAIYMAEYKTALGWAIAEMLDHNKLATIQIISSIPSCSSEWEPEKRTEATCRMLLQRILTRLAVMTSDEHVLEGLSRILPRERAARIIREMDQVL